MASARYTLNIEPQDLQPPEEPPLNKKEKFSNWMHYHKWAVIACAVGLVLVIWFVHDIVTRVDPDYTVAIVSPDTISDEAIRSLETGLESYAEDLNGDGHVSVCVVHYTYDYNTDPTKDVIDAYTRMSGQIQISTDLASGTSLVFLSDDLEDMQTTTGIFSPLSDLGREATDEEKADPDGYSFLFADSKALAAIPLEGTVSVVRTGKTIPASEYFAGFRLGMRMESADAVQGSNDYYNACLKLYQTLLG